MANEAQVTGRSTHFRVNYYVMLVALVGFYLLLPIGVGLLLGATWVVHAAFCLLLVCGVVAAETDRRLFYASLLLAGGVFVLGWVPHILQLESSPPTLRTIQLVLSILFIGFTAYVLLSSIFRTGRITTEGICAALCVYFLIGLLWSNAYMLIERVQPDSFNHRESHATVYADADRIAERTEGISQVYARDVVDTMVFSYFSLITLTTVGYGDIAPQRPLAMTLASVEGFMGQIYIAVLVAWLVGVRVSASIIARQARRPDE